LKSNLNHTLLLNHDLKKTNKWKDEI
jgi:hypothetical protein